MMNRLDGEIGKRDLMMLENHLRVCPGCRRQKDALDAALRELEGSRPAAPASIERKVMDRICGPRRRETAPLLPYAVLPAALLTGMLAILMHGLFASSPVIVIEKAVRVLDLCHKVLSALAAVLRFIINTPFIGEIMAVAGLALVAGIIAFIFAGSGKKGDSGVYWRAVK